MPRKDLSLEEKIKLLEKIKNYPRGTTYRVLSEITKVPKSTIGHILTQEKRLCEEWAENQNTTSKRRREGKNPVVEEALNNWFSTALARGIQITGPILKQKAEEFAKKNLVMIVSRLLKVGSHAGK
jgi:hypothetical protein